METILKISNINKSFSGIKVLHDVSMELHSHEVLCLVGENGAGKSTLIKILSGAEKPESGSIELFSEKYQRLTPKQAMELGVATIYQDADLVESLTVSDNIFLGNEKLERGIFVDKSSQEEATRRLLESLSIKIDPKCMVEELSPGQKQNLQIAKALHRKAKILIMDEPTASLGEEETKALMKLVEKLKNDGLGIIYISHYLEEVFQVGDKAVVLKDGHTVKEFILRETGEEDLIKAMVGRNALNIYKRKRFSTKDNALCIEAYSGAGFVDNVSFSVSRGEIFGLGGLVGAGRTELVKMIYGADKKESGRLRLDGKEITAKNPKDAVNKGIYLISEDRKKESLFMRRTVRENLTISYNEKSFLLNLKKEKELVKKSIDALKIKVFNDSQEVGNLSGGNQQKVVISRWLLEDGQIYIFDEPSKGVDVGAREEIYRIMEELAERGKIIIMISSNMPELISMSDRIGVMREGKLVSVRDALDVTEDELIKEYIGVNE